GAGHGRDRITDFSVGGGDRLLLAAALVDGAQTGAEVIDRFAAVEGGRAVLRFAPDAVIRFDGIADPAALAAAIDIL
ncbi:MAG: hypothetical protein ACK4OP_16180, partial [Gemmobacter sp.]